MANKHTGKEYPASLVIRQMQIKTTTWYNLTLARTANVQTINAGKNVEEDPLALSVGMSVDISTKENSVELP